MAIAFALVSLYQLSFTWITSNVEATAEEIAKGDEQKKAIYLDSISGEGVYNFLWLRNYTYRECQEREINLGLDLKGGMNVTLEVSVVDLIRALSNYNKDSVFVAAMDLAVKNQENSQSDFVTLFGEAFNEIDANAKLASVFNTIELKDRINYSSTNEDVLLVIREETNSAISNTFNILRTRIDRFGVTQPNIQSLGTAGRILVELPGIKEPERVRKLLQGTANLEFWETYDNSEVFEGLRAVNEKLKDVVNYVDTQDSTEVVEVETETVEGDTTELALLEEMKTDSTAVDQNFDLFQKENPLFSLLRPSVSQDGQLYKGATVGTAHKKDTALVNEYLRMPQVRELLPRDLKLLWEVKAVDHKEAGNFFRLIAIKVTNRDGLPALGGEVVTSARAEFGNNQASAEVSMSMNAEGAQTWARLTKDNVGKQIAIVLDGYVYSFPNVSNEITGGRSSITGDFSIAEAKDLANILKSGKLPAPAIILEEEIVGPSLGQEAIDSGLISFIIAFIVVLLYMIFYYNKAGLVANVALIANLFFIFGVLASLGAVLTLPGIAGIVLTIGMSVDANVLIYERIREELALGKNIKMAISDGYRNAYSAILDANITTLLTGIVLYIFGHGPIKGFATTLVIGILTSLFAAIFITRLIFEFSVERNKEVSFASKLTKNAFKNMNIDFIGKRKIAYVVSGVIILIGIVSLATQGLNQGVDFKGGRTYVVRFDETVKISEISDKLKAVYDEAPEVKIYGDDNQVKITTKYLIESKDAEADNIVEGKLFEGVQSMLAEGTTMADFLENHRMSSQKVGPTIADDIKVASVWAILFSLLIMFLYIFMRFKTWQFGLGAIAALTHDVLFVLGLFSILANVMPFSMEINQAFIAAILTVIGYSLNDTVVVFDRIREHMREHKSKDRKSLLNGALNSTLSRTFSTSLSTFIVLLAIFLFGGEVIRGFIFALLVGVVVGTYSSLFIATPVVFDTVKDEEKEVLTSKEYKGGKKKK